MTPRAKKIIASVSFAASALFGGLSFGKYQGALEQEHGQNVIKSQQVAPEEAAAKRASVWEKQDQLNENMLDIVGLAGVSVLALGAGMYTATRKTRRTGNRSMN